MVAYFKHPPAITLAMYAKSVLLLANDRSPQALQYTLLPKH